MSHIVQIQTQIRDVLALRAACRRLCLAEPVHRTVKLFAGQDATGWSVELPGWRYPIVCETTNGQVRYDNFSGHWGDQKELNKLLQAYAAEKVGIEARKQGHCVTEQQLPDGAIKLTIQVAGGAA